MSAAALVWRGVAPLRAGLAVWRYCEASVRHVFGAATGDPVADEVFRALRVRGGAVLPHGELQVMTAGSGILHGQQRGIFLHGSGVLGVISQG